MLRFFLARVAMAVPTLLIIIALAFFLMRLAPGGPFDSARALDPEIAKNLRHIYKLDRPLLEQFWFYLQSLAHGDFGPSLHWRDFTVNQLFATALPISVALGTKAMLLAVLAGTALGLGGTMSKSQIGPRIVDGCAIWNCFTCLRCRAAPPARIWFDASHPSGRRLERWRLAKPNLAGDHACSAADRHRGAAHASGAERCACHAAHPDFAGIWHAWLSYL
jgi:hypothetical protein